MSGINDVLDDAIVHHSAVDLMRIEAGQRSEIFKMMTALEKDLVKEVASADITGVQRTTFQKQRLSALLKQSRETINTYIDDYTETAHNDLYDLAEEEVLFTETMFNNALRAPVVSVALSPSRLKSIAGKTLVEGDFPKQWWGKQSRSLQDAFARQMRTGMLRSETIGELARRVRDNVIPTSRRNALALVRTSSMAVVQEARKASYKQVDDILKGYKFTATLDSRTTKICMSCDGAVFNLDYKVRKGPKFCKPPPLHWGCRSTLSPITKSWNELERQYNGTSKMKDLDMIPTKVRASMDGQVPADIKYTQWLKGKSKTFQNEVLGPVRADLFREGRITNMSNLLDQSGNPLTIPELKDAIKRGALIKPIDRKLMTPDLSAAGKKILAAKELAAKKDLDIERKINTIKDQYMESILAGDIPDKEVTRIWNINATESEKKLLGDAVLDMKDAEIKALNVEMESMKVAEKIKSPDINATPAEIRAIVDSRGNGVSLRTDKGDIEDTEILFYPETSIDKEDMTSAVFKVRRDVINTEGWDKNIAPFNVKKIKKGHLTRTDEWTETEMQPYFQKNIDGVVVKYWGSTEDTHLAFRGRVEIMADGAPDTAVDDIYKVLGKLGIDNKRITPEYEEELYLLQLMYGFNKPAKFKEVGDMLSYIDTPVDRVIFLKKSYNSWVGRKITDSPEYNPSGTYQAFNQGHKLNMRPDLASDPNWLKFSEDYMIHHKFYGKGLTTLKDIVNSGGNLISTTDKLRRGITYSGMSPTADIRSGGASYTFTRIWHKSRGVDVEGIVWKTKVLKRADAISYPTDYYGSVTEDVITKGMHHKGGRVNSVKAFMEISDTHVDNETLFKNSLSIFDDVDHIKILDADYDEAVSFMKKEIGDHFPDGRKVEDVLFRIKDDEDVELKFDADGDVVLDFL